MFFLALAADYDGTIAQFGRVDESTCASLRRLKQTGRRLILVTGRELAELQHAFSDIGVFDLVVAENGAVLHDPSSGETTALAAPPPPGFIEKLISRKVAPISVGRCIVATWEPHQNAVLETIKEFGLDLKIVFNKGAVMILPSAVTKASGLRAALARLDIAARNVVGVGDAENDHAFLAACGCAAAVANALPTVKAAADITLAGDHGAGVAELVDRMIGDEKRLVLSSRLGLPIGTGRDGKQVFLWPFQNVLVMGDSESGKSRFARMLTERMVEKEFEFFVIDPEGDYHGLRHAVAIAQGVDQPRTEEAIRLLRETGVNVVANTVALNLADRRRLVAEILAPMSALKARTGRPHWLIVDEAHQLFPPAPDIGAKVPDTFPASIFITVSPERLSVSILRRIDAVIGLRGAGIGKLASLLGALGAPAALQDTDGQGDEALVWFRDTAGTAIPVRVQAPLQEHRRHLGKYAVGDVGEWHSFYFRGPDGKGNLRARNVWEFAHISSDVDDKTWEHHLRAHDYSKWLRDVIKDGELALQVEKIEGDMHSKPAESRADICRMLLSRYVVPSD